jgi:hypothetical protein
LSSNVVFWLYCHRALQGDYFGGLIAGACRGSNGFWVCRWHFWGRLSRRTKPPPPYDVTLQSSLLTPWSRPGELTALEDFQDVVNFIWDYCHSPEESSGEDSGGPRAAGRA